MWPRNDAEKVLKILWTKNVGTHPDAHEGDLDGFSQGEVDVVVLAAGEGCEPHVGVVPGSVVAVNEVRNDARVTVVLGQHVDVCWVRADLSRQEQPQIRILKQGFLSASSTRPSIFQNNFGGDEDIKDRWK